MIATPAGVLSDRVVSRPSSGKVQAGKGFYRPELDVVRFLAFLCVFLHHTVPRFTGKHGWAYESVVSALGFGLCLFFTLSAYLITSLLLREKDQTGAIHLRQFYIRRALRIWPLYLLGLGVNIATSGLSGTWNGATLGPDLLLGLVMCGNLVPLAAAAHTTIGALWSISLEEQFYVFWPSVMRWLDRRLLLSAAMGIIAIANGVMLYLGHTHTEPDLQAWTNTFVQFECFAAGILLALHEKHRPVISPALGVLIAATAAALWFAAAYTFRVKGHPAVFPTGLDYVAGYALISIGCVLLLLAASAWTRWPKTLIYLGKISFGLYVFHEPVLILLMHYAGARLRARLMSVVCLAVTAGVAALSYRYFETPFLRLKRKHELVHSRPV